MNTNSFLVRPRDQKLFLVTLFSHVSEIKSEDGETDSVKWAWDRVLISMTKGHEYCTLFHGRSSTEDCLSLLGKDVLEKLFLWGFNTNTKKVSELAPMFDLWVKGIQGTRDELLALILKET